MTGPTGIDSEGGPSLETSPTPDVASKENFNESSPPASKVVSVGRETVDKILATITEGVATTSWEVDGALMMTRKQSSKQEPAGVGDDKLSSEEWVLLAFRT